MVLVELLVLGLIAFTAGSDERLAGSAHIVGGNEYITSVVKDLVLELEDYGWWNLKMVDVSQTLNEHMYNWHVSGTVNYTNGFVVSIEKIDLTNFQNSILQNNINGTRQSIGFVRGDLILRDVRVGFDVIAQLDGQPEQRFTGMFKHHLISIRCTISKNMHTDEYTATASYQEMQSGRFVRMAYLPVTHVTQVLSRRYVPGDNDKSVVYWSKEIITPILQRVVKTKQFPRVCFSC